MEIGYSSFVLWIIVGFIIIVTDGQVTIDITPENQFVVSGGSTTLTCRVSQPESLNPSGYISWEECITLSDNRCLRISNDINNIYKFNGGSEARGNRYSISSPGPGQYSLTLTGVTSEDAGRYRCVARNDPNAAFSAQLVVLSAPKPACMMSPADESLLLIGGILRINCSLNFGGNLPPVTDYLLETNNGNRSLESSNHSTEGASTYSLVYTMSTSDQGYSVFVKTYFTVPVVGDKEATNSPGVIHESVYRLPSAAGTGSCGLPMVWMTSLTFALSVIMQTITRWHHYK